MRKVALCLASAAALAASMAVGVPSASAAPCIRLGHIQYDTPGSDLPVTNAKLNAEWVAVHNSCGRTVTITRWELHDRNHHGYTFPTTRVRGHESVRVHTGSGSRSPGNRYWHSGYYVWNNDGDRARLWKGSTLVDQCTWDDDDPGYKDC